MKTNENIAAAVAAADAAAAAADAAVGAVDSGTYSCRLLRVGKSIVAKNCSREH